MKKYTLYCHTNKINGKKYIGITKQNPHTRWRNGEGYKNNEHFYRAIKKYGWHNFSHEILYTNLSLADAEEMEKRLISEYDCTNKDLGYNIQFGGNSGDKFDEETREKISNALKGKPKSAEHKKKISESKIGTKMSVETKKKISDRMRGENHPFFGVKRSIDIYKTKPVICVETGQKFLSTCDASRKTGIDQGSISKVCNGKNKSAGGYHWQFCEGGV